MSGRGQSSRGSTTVLTLEFIATAVPGVMVRSRVVVSGQEAVVSAPGGMLSVGKDKLSICIWNPNYPAYLNTP